MEIQASTISDNLKGRQGYLSTTVFKPLIGEPRRGTIVRDFEDKDGERLLTVAYTGSPLLDRVLRSRTISSFFSAATPALVVNIPATDFEVEVKVEVGANRQP